MKAIIFKSFGGPDVLHCENIDRPTPAKDEFLVKIDAAGVNPVDSKIRSGQFARFVPRLPAVIGRDICGTITSAGKDASGFAKGDRVLGMLDYDRGAYAEYAVASRSELARCPAPVTVNHAAALPVPALTAWQALFEHGRLQCGQRVLIHGATGGVGHFAVQFAVLHKAHVVGTCAGEDIEFLRELGVATAIDYQKENFEEKTGKVDLVVDLVGGKTRSRSWRMLKPGGTLVSTLPAPKPEDRTDVFGKEVVVHSDPIRLQYIADLVAKGLLKVTLANVFPMARANEAHQFLQGEHSRGKTVLSISED